MKKLTAAEERVMQVLWKKEKALAREVMEALEQPLSYTTVSTTIRILENKGFVGHRAFGKTYQYFPLIEKSEYRKGMMAWLVRDYFDNSYRELVSHFAKEDKISAAEIEEIAALIREEGENEL